MIYIDVNDQDYYDETRVLVKSFYTKEEVTVNPEDEHEMIVKVVVTEGSVAITITNKDEEFFIESKVSGTEKKDYKDSLKKGLYKLLNGITGKNLPWGMLTGVRPAKIASKILEEGGTDEDIYAKMMDYYKVSKEKTELSIEVAKKEREVLKKTDFKKGYSLYIGIPFCPTTCLYCSFTSYPLEKWGDRVDTYLEALIKEIEFTAKLCNHKCPDSIYFGGGTPTTLKPEQLDRLLCTLENNFDLSKCLELTVEAGRPDSITMDKLKVLKAHKVDRISINPQTMKQETLDLIGRKHTVTQIREAYAMARECGFTNINMDLILGLPGEVYEDVENTMKEIKAMAPESLTIHSLAIKRAAALKLWQKKNLNYDMVNTDDIINMTARYAKEMGVKPYYMYRQKNMAGNFENVGYAKEGYECLYNILIMEEVQTIIALGAGSITKRVFGDGRIERCDNVKDIGLYIEKIDEMIERKRELFNLK